jgi:hypothetical protein
LDPHLPSPLIVRSATEYSLFRHCPVAALQEMLLDLVRYSSRMGLPRARLTTTRPKINSELEMDSIFRVAHWTPQIQQLPESRRRSPRAMVMISAAGSPAIAARLGPTAFALWSDTAGARWHLSTGHSTIVLGGPQASALQLQEIAPAKGGGHVARSRALVGP